MCGICGLVHALPETRADLEALDRMNAALAHRGPDDQGTWHGGHAALGHRRLSILDPTPAGHQPWLSPDGRRALVYNGEIYNFRELAKELMCAGRRFRTECDTEVLMAALEQWGDEAVTRLNGMFVFAYYDADKRRTLLVRDRLGIKPLFYTLQNGCLGFASELDALRQSRCFDLSIRPEALDAYLAYLYIPEPDTIYRNVFQVRPGEKVVFENGTLRTKRYWRLEYDIDPAWTLDTAAEAYRNLLEDAVRLRRVSDVPLGAFLSGGLDSSSVVGMLSNLSDRKVKTFSIGFDDAEADELAYARIAARHFATDHTEEILHPDMAELLPRLVRHFGEPFADSSALPTWLVSQVARREVTVALSGDGGDELLAGYRWLHMNCHVARYRRVPKALRQGADCLLRALPDSPRVRQFQRFSHDSFLDALESFRRRQTCFTPENRAMLYAPEFAETLPVSPEDRYIEHAAAAPGDPQNAMLYQDTMMYLPGDILAKVDRMSMAHALEARVPLLDYRLVEFAATVPFHLKYDGHTSKRLAKHAMRGFLPPELLTQRKRGFAIPSTAGSAKASASTSRRPFWPREHIARNTSAPRPPAPCLTRTAPARKTMGITCGRCSSSSIGSSRNTVETPQPRNRRV